MYPSNSNGSGNTNTNTNTNTNPNPNPNPISYSLDQPIPYRPFLYDIIPNSKQDDLPSSLFHFPSPYIHYEDDVVLLQHLHDLLLQQQQPPPPPPLSTADEGTATAPEAMTATNMADSNKQCHSVLPPRKRSSKKDRHSKIDTAHGPRDRRMRLSLEVAREFFNLQDMLGFDKASKTVEWLLTKSRAAIEELTGGHPHHMKHSCSVVGGGGAAAAAANSTSSTSECEVVSGIDESAGGVDGNRLGRTNKGKPSSSSSSSAAKEKKSKALRKSAFHPLAKESREKARARARERTEKRRFGESKLLTLEAAMNHDMNRLGSWSPFENGEESGTHSHNININININPPHLEVLAAAEADVHEELSSSMIFNYDPHNSTGINSHHEHHQFTDFQVYGKPWEAYNNI